MTQRVCVSFGVAMPLRSIQYLRNQVGGSRNAIMMMLTQGCAFDSGQTLTLGWQMSALRASSLDEAFPPKEDAKIFCIASLPLAFQDSDFVIDAREASGKLANKTIIFRFSFVHLEASR